MKMPYASRAYTPKRAYSPLRTTSRQEPTERARAHSVPYVPRTAASDVGGVDVLEHFTRYGEVVLDRLLVRCMHAQASFWREGREGRREEEGRTPTAKKTGEWRTERAQCAARVFAGAHTAVADVAHSGS